MAPQAWRNIDRAHLLHKVILLQWLNRTPETPAETNLSESRLREHDSCERVLSLQHECDLAKAFAFLAARTDDPKEIVAVCLEEGEEQRCLTIRLAMNSGNLDNLRVGFEKMAKILERVVRIEQSTIEQEQHALLCEVIAMNQNRILIRLRSHHAKLRCNFKKDKMHRPKIIPQLFKAINSRPAAQTLGITPMLLTALIADIEKLHGLFADLENLATPRAKSSSGLAILVQLIITCQHIHDQRILHQALTDSSQLAPSSRAGIVQTITKLGRYSTVSKFLLQAARKYSVFNKVQISPICIKAPKLLATEFDSMTTELIHSLQEGSKLKKSSKSHASLSFAIEDHIRHEATLTVPVHAEVQLLFHYEQNPCKRPPRIICSSKKACFLCNLFFKIDGRYIIPSTHGRIYEKWALPCGWKNMGYADGSMLTTIWNFVSAVEKALLCEVHSTKRPHPDPYESMILQSAVCSQSNQSTTSIRKTISQRPMWPQDPLSPSKNDATSPKNPLVPYAAKMANVSTNKNATECVQSRFERSSAVVQRDLSPSNELPRSTSSEEAISYSVLRLFLTKGQPVWRKMSSNFNSFEVRTPRIHLTISQDEPFCNLWPQDTSHNLVAGSGHYWIFLEYLSQLPIQQGETVPIVNLLDVPYERDMIVEFDSAEWPQELRVYCNHDAVSLKIFPCKPLDRPEYRK